MMDIIDVLCCVFPDGNVLWIDNKDTVGPAVERWKKENPSYERCLGGFVLVKMPREVYQNIPATNWSAALTS